MNINEILKKEDIKNLGVLVSDLVVLGDFNLWKEPTGLDNINWFLKEAPDVPLKISHRDDFLLSKRLKELVDQGADLTEKAYSIANINRPLMLKTALDNGANPNLKNKAGYFPISRAVSRNRSKIVSVLINDQSFDWNIFPEILMEVVAQGNYKLAQDIIDLKPEYIINKSNGSSVFHSIAAQTHNQKFKPKILSFIKNCLKYADENNYQFNINEPNDFGVTIHQTNPEISKVLVSHYANNLEKELPLKEKEPHNINFKI